MIIVSALIVAPWSTRDPKITFSLWQSLLTDRFTDDNYEKRPGMARFKKNNGFSKGHILW